MEEYANMRFTSRWAIATNEPKTIVIIAIIVSAGVHDHWALANAV